MKPILLFDIDGTLLHVKKSFTKELIYHVMKDLDFTQYKLSEMSFAGRTDKDIFNEITGLITDEPEKRDELFKEIKHSYLTALLNELQPDHVEVIHGATEVIYAAAGSGLEIGLCTGNFREAAHKKVEAAGFGDTFFFGGFGCEHADRKHLPEAAHTDYVQYSGMSPERESYVIIGDTPNDVRSAKYFGARSVAVTTGGFSRDELAPHKPDWVVESLQEIIPIYFPS
jgi:phosphoglycolate phosphatase-like HAD superfamily hydrolase